MVSRLLTISRALKTPLVMLAAAILGLAVPGSTAQAQCGGENQRPCGILERIPSCNTGMKEDFGKGKCVKMATPCGAAGQRPCQIVERALSCNPGSYEDVGQKLCVQKTPCGAVDQRPCRIDERIPSCDKGLYEDLGKAKCFVHGDFLRDGNAKCVHVPGVSHANGVQLRTWDCVNMAHLTWEKVPGRLDIYTDQEAGFQFFWLKNRLTGKCAAVHAGQKQDGSQVIQWDCGNGKHFQWAWDVNGRLRNRESLKCVNSESGSQNAPLTIVECPRIEVPNEAQWTFDKPPEKTGIADYSPENTPTVLKNGFGRCLQVPQGNNADGVQLSTWECNAATASIRWVQEKGITVDRAYFWFKNRMTGGCLAVQSGAKNDGAPVVQLQCGGEPQGENFHWKWTAGKQLVNRESGKCLQASSLEPATIKQCIQLAISTNNLWSFVKPGGETYR